MSRVSVATVLGESPKAQLASTRLLASAHSCAQRVQLSLEGLGGASNLLSLTGVGLGLAASYLVGAMIEREVDLR
jgi:hypothetical protein